MTGCLWWAMDNRLDVLYRLESSPVTNVMLFELCVCVSHVAVPAGDLILCLRLLGTQ
jgi:hypothetical protein